MKFERITVDPDRMGGVPCVRGLRIPVATVVGMVAEGMTEAEILKAYPDLGPNLGCSSPISVRSKLHSSRVPWPSSTPTGCGFGSCRLAEVRNPGRTTSGTSRVPVSAPPPGHPGAHRRRAAAYPW
ncbi:MAG: DUF433 domain-containing protein [Armatimonadetes bacterium]|nr:DUF433 domain-containing protein [Armatimonadota bacterium]